MSPTARVALCAHCGQTAVTKRGKFVDHLFGWPVRVHCSGSGLSPNDRSLRVWPDRSKP